MRQLFDDNTRHDHKKHHSNRHSAIYSDAKHTSIDENLFELKNGHQSQSIIAAVVPSTRNIDFERVKQKFDKPNTSTSSASRNNKKARNFSSFLKFSSKRAEVTSTNNDVDSIKIINNNVNLSDSIESSDKLILNDSLVTKNKDAYMNSSMNLDGLKVSEDDDDDNVSKCYCKLTKLRAYCQCCRTMCCVFTLNASLFVFVFFFFVFANFVFSIFTKLLNEA